MLTQHPGSGVGSGFAITESNNIAWYLRGERDGTGKFNIGNSSGNKLTITGSNVGIGCDAPQYKLHVNGTVKATQFRANATGCDFVFEGKHKLPTIPERKAFTEKYNHLPNIKPAKDMQENGMDITGTAEGLLQNVEEHELYLYNHDEKIELLLKQQEELKIENRKLREEINTIKALLNNK